MDTQKEETTMTSNRLKSLANPRFLPVTSEVKISFRWLPYLIIVCMIQTPFNAVSAHELGVGYITLKFRENSMYGIVELQLSDLDKMFTLDTDKNSNVSESELEKRIADVRGYVAPRVKLAIGDRDLHMRYTDYTVYKAKTGHWIRLNFDVIGVDQIPQQIEIEYNLFFEMDPRHRGMLYLRESTKRVSIFTPTRKRQILNLTTQSHFRSFIEFVRHGIWHIWIGIDHILFLLALVVTSVLLRKEDRWEPVTSFREALINIVKIVTLFTVAHSITLTLAAFQIVQLPSRIVESIIALSVAIAALNNIYPYCFDRLWLLIFGFGLFHGLGFANVLGQLGLQQISLALPLLGFNVGVEIGQIAIIAVCFPILFAIRRKSFYEKTFLRYSSLVITVIAIIWFIDRAFGINIPIITDLIT